MNNLNQKLVRILSKKNLVARSGATNKQDYSQDKWLILLMMLNTLRLESQNYKKAEEILDDLKDTIRECALDDPYFTAQCVVWSRALGRGMKAMCNAASVFLAPYVSGREFAKYFYSKWNKRSKKGGVILTPEDMESISKGFSALNSRVITATKIDPSTGKVGSKVTFKGPVLSNAMKKGFKMAIEDMDTHTLLRYRSSLIDIINLVHPNPSLSQAICTVEGKEMYTLEAIIANKKVSTDTWELSQNDINSMTEYGFAIYEDMIMPRFNAKQYINEVKKVVIWNKQ